MPRHVYDPQQSGEPPVPSPNATPDLATAAHDDLAMMLPAWDLLPPAEFVRRRPSGG